MQQDILGMLDEYAAREQKAYANYRRQYQRETPPPRKPSRWVGFPWSTIPFAVIALAGSLLSALRTAPVFIEIASLTVSPVFAAAEGILAMLAIDMAVVAFRFILVMLQYRGHETQAGITRWVRFGFWFAFATQLIAQVYAVREIATILNAAAQWLELAIAMAAALSGMILAFVTGEILAVLVMQSQAARKEARDDYTAALNEWQDSLRRSWNRNKGNYGIEPPPELRQLRPTLTTLSEGVSTDNADRGTDSTDNRRGGADMTARPPSPSEAEVMAYLENNPEAVALTVRELADITGINRDAVSKAKRRLSEPVSANGHSNGTH